MRRRPALALYLLLWLAISTALGCAHKRGSPVEEEPPPPPPSVGRMQMGGSVVRVADPGENWLFTAESPNIEADSMDGPYRLEPADCKYQQKGKPPVLMQAARAEIDRTAQRVVLEKDVSISYGAWSMVGERVVYDLKQGKVVASGPTKLTYDPDSPDRRPDAGRKEALP